MAAVTKAKNEKEHILKERDIRKNFNEPEFVADMIRFYCKRAVDETARAKKNRELTAVCNLYEMINLQELREMAHFDCDFGLIDEYRDIILEGTEYSLRKMGLQISDTYRTNPYMVCTFTIACTEMGREELDRLGNNFTTSDDLKKTGIVIIVSIMINFTCHLVITLLKTKVHGISLPAPVLTYWPQFTLALTTLLISVMCGIYYFRRTITAYFTERKIKKRL